jgi:hypothetical protein
LSLGQADTKRSCNQHRKDMPLRQNELYSGLSRGGGSKNRADSRHRDEAAMNWHCGSKLKGQRAGSRRGERAANEAAQNLEVNSNTLF